MSAILDLPPLIHDVAHERMVAAVLLGSPMTDPGYSYLLQTLDIEHFHDHLCEMIFKTCQELYSEGIQPNPVNVHADLSSKGQDVMLHAIRHLELEHWFPICQSAAQRYSKKLNDARNERDLQMAHARMTAALSNNDFDKVKDITLEMEEIRERVSGTFTTPCMPVIAMKVMERIDKKRKGEIAPGILTGYHSLDDKIVGLGAGELLLISSYDKDAKSSTSVGKSAFAHNLAIMFSHSTSTKRNYRGAIFSLEMSTILMFERMLSTKSDIPFSKILDPKRMSDAEFKKANNISASVLSNFGIWIEDTENMKVSEFHSKASELKRDHNIRWIIIDYLQLFLPAKSSSKDSRETEVARMAFDVKMISKELNLPIIILCQVNADGDIRESKAIEMHAAIHLQLIRNKMDAGNAIAQPCTIVIKKNRNGWLGEIPFTFFPKTMTFKEGQYDEGVNQ